MSELTSNQYLIIIAVLVFISIVMLFLLNYRRLQSISGAF